MRALAFLICSALVSLSAAGQESYPSKPIRVLVGYAAGGGNDIIVRVMAPELSRGLGQPIVVENKPGAQSIIAADAVAKSAPDGYTIFMGPSGPMTINPATYSKLPYDPQRDFAPISLIAEFPLFVTVNAQLPIHSVKELIAYAKGSNQSVQAVVSGQVMMTIVDPPPATPAIKGGTLRALAVTSAKRHPAWPDIPTMTEAGVPDMEVPVWTAFFFPANTPPEIVARMQKEVARVVHTPEVKERFAAMGIEPVGSSSAELAAVVARDLAKYKAVAKAANIHND
jgi:tripartite-type tricarboxylate transporter receptor subunit TctC